MVKSIIQAIFTLGFFIALLMFLTKLKLDATNNVYIKPSQKVYKTIEKKELQKESIESLDE